MKFRPDILRVISKNVIMTAMKIEYSQEQILLAKLLENDPSLHGAAYAASKTLWQMITVVTSISTVGFKLH